MSPHYSLRVASSRSAGEDDSFTSGLREQNLRFILGLKLHNLRKERDLSLVQLSKVSGLSVSYLNEIEKGKKFPKSDKLLALARAFGVSYDDLVSADPGEKLRPISHLLTTRALGDLPLEFFGVGPPVLMEMMAGAPDRLGALLSFLDRLSTRYDFGTEELFEAAIRSHLENNDYHFEELETEAAKFARSRGWPAEKAPKEEQLRKHLQESGWEIDDSSLGTIPELSDISVLPVTTGRHKCLLLNPSLSTPRRLFYLAREAAAALLAGQKIRPTRSRERPREFDEVLNKALAAYVAGALVIPRRPLVADLRRLFANKTWNAADVIAMVEKHGGDVELVFHRIAQLLKSEFGIASFALIRTEHQEDSPGFEVTRELRFGEVPEIPGADLGEHRCPRPLAVQLLKEISSEKPALCAGARRDVFPASKESYFYIAVASPQSLQPDGFCCITLAFLIDDAVRHAVAFVSDKAVGERVVGEACEDCGRPDCAERAPPPGVREKSERRARQHAAVKKLLSTLDA